jgi:hypothetical protein
MKKFSLIALAAGLIAAGVGVNLRLNSQNEMQGIMMVNLEALSSGESGGSSTSWNCWSEQKEGLGYQRCGNPCVWVDNYGSKGPKSKCYK